MTIAARIAEVQRRRADLDQELDLLEKLPSQAALSLVTRVRGTWHLYLTGPVQEALTQLPPSNARMSLDNGTWVAAPENRPLDWTQRVLAVHANRSGVLWSHFLEDGTLVHVHVEGAALPVPEGYERSSSVHSTVLMRKRQEPADCRKVLPSEEDARAWREFFDIEAYTHKQRAFGHVFKALASRGQPVSFEMLPVPAADTMALAGSTLHVLRAGGYVPESTPAGSPLHGLSSVGSFWSHFDRAQAERLVAFTAARSRDLETADAASVRVGIDAALAALAEFEQRYLHKPLASAITADVLTNWVKDHTGYPVHVSLRSPVHFGGPRYVQPIWVHLWKWNESATIRVPSNSYDPAGFDFQDPDFYEYEPNLGRF